MSFRDGKRRFPFNLRQIPQDQAGSTVASSMSKIGRPSRTGYTLRHAVHFSASGADLSSSGFLHAGHTRRSSKSWAIMTGRLYDG